MTRATEPSRPSSPPAQTASQVHQVPPQATLMQLLFGVPIVHMIATGVELGLFEAIGSNVLSSCFIAESCGTPIDTTHRLLRGLSVLGVVNEHSDERFSLSPIGKLLLPDTPGSFDALARLSGAAWLGDAYRALPKTVRGGKSGFTETHDMPLFEWLSSKPEEQELFGRGMSTFSAIEAELIVGHYDFSQTRHAVDVGGGHGFLLSRILEAAPRARGTLFDVEGTIEQARKRFDPELAERCDFVAGDFFESVPKGADLYLLKHILHDWDEENALQILTQVADAMPHGATLLVLEQGIAQPGIPNSGKMLDIVMLGLVDGGRERTVEQHASLLGRAGLDFEREVTTPGPITLFVAHK